MKRKHPILLAILAATVVCVLALSGCAQPSPADAAAQTVPPVASTAGTVATEPATEGSGTVSPLQGKTLSILGDSISTFSGWSNSTAVNDTLGEHDVWYRYESRLPSVDQTWWKRTVDAFGMEILVNNSWSGSSVTSVRATRGRESFGWNLRPGELHDNTLRDNPEGEPIAPDIIVIYMGTNDLMDGVSCETGVFGPEFWAKIEAEGFTPPKTSHFEEACALMVCKVRRNYPDAEIFCFNNPLMITGDPENRAAYNEALQIIAQRYGCHLVDLYGSPISDYSRYTHDGIHPTAEGMAVMAEVFSQCLAEVF